MVTKEKWVDYMLGLTGAVLEVMATVNVISKNIKSANGKFRRTARDQSNAM